MHRRCKENVQRQYPSLQALLLFQFPDTGQRWPRCACANRWRLMGVRERARNDDVALARWVIAPLLPRMSLPFHDVSLPHCCGPQCEYFQTDSFCRCDPQCELPHHHCSGQSSRPSHPPSLPQDCCCVQSSRPSQALSQPQDCCVGRPPSAPQDCCCGQSSRPSQPPSPPRGCCVGRTGAAPYQ